MISPKHPKPSAGHRKGAFTLIEIVVALTILAVIAAVAIPTLKGLNQEEKARAPIQTLAEVVQEVRQRAMRERRAYQIVFEREGIHASPAMYPYDKREEFLKQLEEMRTPPIVEPIERIGPQRVEVERQGVENGRPLEEAPVAAEEPTDFEMPWTVTIPLDPETECEVLMWGDGEWDVVDGEKMRRWVFQPSGMASPASVRLRSGAAKLEATFDLLTGELTAERSRKNYPQP
jgi:prepilin-type N-terminal cleavage/methylation domain-containing protein